MEERAYKLAKVWLNSARDCILNIKAEMERTRPDEERILNECDSILSDVEAVRREFQAEKEKSDEKPKPLPEIKPITIEPATLSPKKVRLSLVKKTETGEYVVKVYKDGKYSEDSTYYTDDEADAKDTLKHMAASYKESGAEVTTSGI